MTLGGTTRWSKPFGLLSPLVGLAMAAGFVRADGVPSTFSVSAAPAAIARVGTSVPVADVDRALEALESEERSMRAELENLGPTRHDLDLRVRARGRQLFRLVRAGMLPVAGGLDALLDHALRIDRARRGLERDAHDLKTLQERTIDLGRRLDDLSTRRTPLLIQQQVQSRARAVLDEADDRKRAFDTAFQTSTGSPEHVAVYGGGISPDDGAGGSFASRKGKLPFPVAGRSEIRGIGRGASGGPGMEIQAPAGTLVRAVFGGRVAFADRYDPFGPIVIVDHGDHYYTLMGNLGSTDVRVGDDLSAGARVGTVGSGPHGAYLYFEVRKGASAIEPGPWLGLR